MTHGTRVRDSNPTLLHSAVFTKSSPGRSVKCRVLPESNTTLVPACRPPRAACRPPAPALPLPPPSPPSGTPSGVLGPRTQASSLQCGPAPGQTAAPAPASAPQGGCWEGGAGAGAESGERGGPLGQEDYSRRCFDGGYTSLYVHLSPQSVQHQE